MVWELWGGPGELWRALGGPGAPKSLKKQWKSMVWELWGGPGELWGALGGAGEPWGCKIIKNQSKSKVLLRRGLGSDTGYRVAAPTYIYTHM